MATKESEPTATRFNADGDALTTVLMMGAALAAIAGFGVLFSLWWRTSVSDHYEVLRIASQEFVNGRPVVAGELAESVEFEEDSDILDQRPREAPEDDPRYPVILDNQRPEEQAAREAREELQKWIRLRDFLVGVGKVARAREEEDVRERRRLLYQAVPFLQSARDAGFPPGRQTQGHRILGESLFRLGRYDDAIVELTSTIDRDPTLRRELMPMLAEAQLKSLAPRTSQALQTIEEFLGDPTLQPASRWEGELIRVQALINLNRWSRASDVILRELAKQPTSEMSLQALEADYRDQLTLYRAVIEIQKAIERFGALPVDDYEDRSEAAAAVAPALTRLGEIQREASPAVAAQARLWSARTMLVQGRIDAALTQLTALRTQRPFGAEAIIGGLEEIELLADRGRGVEMLQTTRFVIRELGDARGFDASMITFEEFQRRLSAAIEKLRRRGEFKNAIDAARSLPPVFEVSEALTQEGIGFREWAEATLADATDIDGQTPRSASKLARARYRAAGDAFARAAKLQFKTKQYLTTQWAAIDAYQKGRHFTQSIRLLEPYLRYEERRRRPRGLLAYGRALLAEDQPDKAIDALTTCIIEFERDPLRYDARLLAALAYAEKGDFDSAKSLLTDNLRDGELTPQSPSWRDSLMTLGELTYERGYHRFLVAQRAEGTRRMSILRDNQEVLAEAIRYLDEAVQRYWPIARAESAAYLSARAHVMSSEWPRIESQSPEILDAARRALRAQVDQELQTALDGFIALRKHLVGREEEQRLPNGKQSMLRNCLIAEADVLREMNRLEDAASAYRTVELRYMNEPPALEAILGRATCAKRLGRPQEADQLVRQASVVLQRIPNEWNDRFEETTRYDRAGWESFLAWMSQRINDQGGA